MIDEPWHPTRTLTTWLSALMAVLAVSQLAQIGDGLPHSLDRFASAINAVTNGHDALAQSRFEHASDGSAFTIWQAAGYLSVAFLVVVIIWQWRSQSNANVLGRTGARISPGWGIAGWLIPGANAVVPYLVFQDLWRSSAPDAPRGEEWRSRPSSPLVTAWWIAWIFGSFTPFVATILVLSTSTSVADTDTSVKAAHFTLAAAYALGIFVVRAISENQERQRAAEPPPVQRPSAAEGGRATGEPGWYPDPLARFEHRYWDGQIWTEWVSTEGQLAIDTQPVPGYD